MELNVKELYSEANEVQRAYFDCWPMDDHGLKWERLEPYRNLDWKSQNYYSVEDTFNLFKSAVHGYNDFNPSLIKKISELFKRPKICPAREGSVCIYVKGKPKNSLEEIRATLMADECDQYGKEIRIWWD